METYERIDKVLDGNMTKEELELEYAFLAKEYMDLSEYNMGVQRAVLQTYGEQALQDIQTEAAKTASEILYSGSSVKPVSSYREIPREAAIQIFKLGVPVYGIRDEDVTLLTEEEQIGRCDTFQINMKDADSKVCEILFDLELGLES